MKGIALALVAVLCASTALSDQVKTSRPRRRPLGKPTGGIVEKQMVSKVLRVYNTSSLLPADKVSELTRDFRYTVQLPIEVVSGEKPTGCPFEAADQLVAQKNVGAGVLVLESDTLPIFLIAPDRKWAILNVAPLKADSPSPEKLFERFNKVYWGAIGRALGAGTTASFGCVIAPFTNLAELDTIKADRPCPEACNKMLDTGHALGLKTLTIASYRTACEKGWAPPPANDEQKAIWEEVHALPTEPIKIKPETKKVTE